MPYGLFIEFSNRLVGLAPSKFLANEFIAQPAAYFKVGQTVVAKVLLFSLSSLSDFCWSYLSLFLSLSLSLSLF